MTTATLVQTEPPVVSTHLDRPIDPTFYTAICMGYHGTSGQYGADVTDYGVKKRLSRWGSGLVAGDDLDAKRTTAGILIVLPTLEVLASFPEIAAFGFLGVAAAGAAYAAWSLSCAQAQWLADRSYLQQLRSQS